MNPSKRNVWGLFNLGAAATIWGSTFVVSRYALASVSFLHLVILRFACSTALFIPRGGNAIATAATHPALVGGIAYLAVISTFLGFYLWTLGLQQVTSVSASSLMFFCQPLAGTVLGMLVLHEHVTAQTIIGSGLILTGLLVSIGRSRVNTL